VDAEPTIAEIERLERIFVVPDTRTLNFKRIALEKFLQSGHFLERCLWVW